MVGRTLRFLIHLFCSEQVTVKGFYMKVEMLYKLNGLVLVMLTAGVVSLTLGCQQDPLADQPETVRRGIPVEVVREPPAAKPVKQEALRIDANDFFSFKEGIAGEAVITGRVLMPNVPFKIEIENMASEFPGSTYDSTTGVFKWTPSRDALGVDYGTAKRLVVRLTTTGVPILGTTKSILIHVTRGENDPEIVAVEDLVTVFTREGKDRKFLVTVRDPDSADFDGARPKLFTIPSRRGPNDVSGLVYMEESKPAAPNPVQDPNDKSLWIFKMVMDLTAKNGDLRGRDFTRGEERFFFGLQALSRYGRIAVRPVDVTIRTSVMKPLVSWLDPIEVVADQENTVQFTVFDPHDEGKLDLNFTTRVDQLPGKATQHCTEALRGGGMLLCKISWKPLMVEGAGCTNQPDKSMLCDIKFEVRNSSQVAGDSEFVKESFGRKLKVIRVTPVSPANSGAPAAVPVAVPAVANTH